MKKTFLFASAFIATVASATTIDTSVLGDYKITYTVTDSGGKTSSVSRIVHVVKNELPVITLSGGDITMYAGDAFVEPGFSALDKEDGDLSAKVVVTNNVDTAAPGVYKVVYTLVDSFGNSVSKERIVTVIEKPNDAPVITLNGEEEITVYATVPFNDPGVNALDKEDGDLSSEVRIQVEKIN